MDKIENKVERKRPYRAGPAPARAFDEKSSNMKAFAEFQKALEQEVEGAILERMRSFREEILKLRDYR